MPELEKIRGMGGGRGVIIFALMELEGGSGDEVKEEQESRVGGLF